ncbi:hypothetical protein AYI69_g6666 [Smittium culicis]|uniref:Uncharacterized protein n=1 Tax=Smittium culicis TaxID=133412 RepID=A0A1R1XXJ8_9FUNG|nr:hypothetical protein AYI69_g6666 [Smittium culicis]
MTACNFSHPAYLKQCLGGSFGCLLYRIFSIIVIVPIKFRDKKKKKKNCIFLSIRANENFDLKLADNLD